jgi:phospho-N-acetylmuramoyl-pentapeptide-transferase
MISILEGTADLAGILGFALFSCIIAFLWSPILIKILYRFNVVKGQKKELENIESQKGKDKTPVMGGLLIIITVAIITISFNWSRSYTWVPISVMLLSALLGAIDDLLNIFGAERRSRKLSQIFTLIKVHKDFKMRLWYIITLPWSFFKRTSVWIGSRTNRGIAVHEKLLLQFAAGSITAWWIYDKLGTAWHYIYLPFNYDIYAGWMIIPFIILIVMFTANAVNIADGMDGLAGGMLLSSFSALTLLSWINGFGEIAILNATVVGALVTYTYFNIKPARFMMGDVGSLGLGALFAVNTVAIGEIGSIFFLGFVFYIEALSVVIQIAGKYILGRKIFKMAPIHHHFEINGWSEEKTIMRFWIIHFIFVVFGIWLALH